MKQIMLLDVPVNIGTYNQFVQKILYTAQYEKKGYACIANVHMLVESHRNKQFAKDIWNATFITPDGKPLAWALKLIYGIQQDRVAGMDLLPDLIRESAKKNMSVYFYGGTEEGLQLTQKYMTANFPGLIVKGGYSPPFRKLSKTEEEEVVTKINGADADMLFVVLGCPKQEAWMAKMNSRINSFMIGVGGALPVMIGLQKRAPVWMQHAGFEWLFRLMQEPKRLFKRYAITNSVFILLLLKKIISYRWEGKISTTFESN